MVKYITDESLPHPNEVQISVDFSQRELTFSWSPVAPDCPAVHYNILASNCGSCPTTTNHTNVTCTDVQRKGGLCIFALQTVVCGNIIGNTSDPIAVSIISANTVTEESRTVVAACTCAIPTSSLAAALIIVVMTSIIVVVVTLVRSKAKIKAALEQPNRAERTIHMDPMYEDATGPLSSASAINTEDNVAYGHTHQQ
jgi:hypothetical protein